MWAAWVDPNNKPVRACVAAPMAHPDILVEVMVVAAKLKRSESISPFFSKKHLLPLHSLREIFASRLPYLCGFADRFDATTGAVWPDAAGTGGGKSQPLRGKRLTTGVVP